MAVGVAFSLYHLVQLLESSGVHYGLRRGSFALQETLVLCSSFPASAQGVFVQDQRHLNKCFLPHGHGLGIVFYLPASLQPQPSGKMPGKLLGKWLSSRDSLQPALSKPWCQGKEVVGADGALLP